ncbi:uncharacterized protein LOC110973232 [Acanthaster planci]|uniref:Uncharacterized protein LOC110973232 n=1 Tax=Acanthaster planci TaxID=133434 RepID=A0A8B7XI37_ACAPL|nr:uncharacterized protein LOC110973232 [Acanthaster planci]
MASKHALGVILPTLLVFTASLHAGWAQTVITNTTLGPVMGIKVPYLPWTEQLVTRYTGIPYAEPPIGQLRFAKPVPKTPWDDVFNATVFGPSCPQPASNSTLTSFLPNDEIDEDCLLLNVYVPHDAVALSGPLSVMVFIHGGGLVFGQGMYYDGTLLALQGQVIMVNFNYRLGIFGFFSTGDDSAPGNYGLWDQRLALQWVKDNIANFGGDPDQITIFGESAGGWSVTLQMISPLNSNNLFQRVIAESGVVFPNLMIPADVARLQAFGLASALKCNPTTDSSSRSIIQCLRNVSMETLLIYTFAASTSPIIDGDFFPTDITSLLTHPRIGQYDLIMGFNDQDGSVLIGSVDTDGYTAEEFRAATGYFMQLCQCKTSHEITNAVFAYYFGADKLDDPMQNVVRYLDVTGDVYFDVASINFLTRHAQAAANTSTYFYHFTYETGRELFLPPEWLDVISGAPHALEIFYVFGFITAVYPNDTEAALLSNRTIEYWTQFARYGNPNGASLPEWPKFETENKTYILLDADIKTGHGFKSDRVAFWNDYIPTITDPTYEKTCTYELPIRSGTVQKPGTKTVQIESKDGEVLGSVIGTLEIADKAMGGREVAEFLGIPYAKPPLGDLRFKPPEDTGPWGDQPLGIPEKLPPACPQDVTLDPWMVRLGFNQTSEDCLTLNIYTPIQDSGNPALPVLVFIHSGDGISGTSSVYDATLLASQVEAVVVVINYRLGALGFLSTEDKVAPGNYGLRDIVAALKWVNKYIGSFGGDPEQVTLQGHGSGAVLTHFLVLSEKAKGLFNKVILMSATAISPSVNNPVLPVASEAAQALAIKLECPTTSTELIECLREKPVADIISSVVNPSFGLEFPPVVDGDLITDKPLELLKAGRINDVDVIVGLAKDQDAAQAFMMTSLDCPSVEEVEQYIEKVSKHSFNNPDEAAFTLNTEYIGKGGLGDDCETRGSFRQFMNDYLSYWSTLEAARLHANAGHSVYFYSFDLKPLAHYKGPLPPQAGPAFADDLQFLFGDPYSPLVDKLQLSYRLEDKQSTLELMEFLKKFLHTGVPGTSASGVEWPSFDSDNLKYMSLTDCPQAFSGVDNDWPHLLRFWASYLPSITAPVPPPPEVTPCPPDQEPCTVGESIGLKLTPEEASTIIQALIGTTVGALVLSVFFLGGCVAYKTRANQAEKQNARKKANKDLIYTESKEDENTFEF